MSIGGIAVRVRAIRGAWRHLCTVLATVAACACAMAHDYTITKISLPYDIVTDRINVMLRSSNGLLWIGSASGLQSYDGYDFVNYQSTSGDTTTLRSNYVSYLAEDNSQRLWIKTDKGYSIYDFASETFTNDIVPIMEGMGISGEPLQVGTDKDSNLWLYVDEGQRRNLYCLRPDKPTAMLVSQPTHDLLDEVVSFAANDKYLILINSRGQLVFVDRAHGIIDGVYSELARQLDPAEARQLKAYASKIGSLGLWTDDKAWIYDINNRQLSRADLRTHSGNERYSILYDDAKGRTWIGQANEGMRIVNKAISGQGINMQSHNINELDNHTVTCLYEDPHGTMWIGTLKHGLYCYNEEINHFGVLEMPDVNVIAKSSDPDYAWLGTASNGLWKWKISENAASPLADDKMADNRWPPISAICDDGCAGVYVGHLGGGLMHYDGNNWTRVGHSDGLVSNDVSALLTVPDGSIWIGTPQSGLQRIGSDYRPLAHYSAEHGQLPSQLVTSLAYDGSRHLYIATDNGMAILDVAADTLTHIPGSKLASGHINQVHVDSSGLVWIATHRGLNTYDPADGSICTVNLHLPSTTPHVLGITEDSDGDIWISVGCLLCHVNILDPKDKKYEIHVFNSNNGLKPSDFNPRSMATVGHDIIAGGDVYGVSYCHPAKLVYSSVPPRVYFTHLDISGQPVKPMEKVNGYVPLKQPLTFGSELHIHNANNNFAIFFATDNFVLPENTRYYYQLSGVTSGWTPCPVGSHHVSFTNLAPGKYKLLVKAANFDGIFSTEAAELAFVVHPSFLQSRLANVLLALLIILIAGSVIRMMRVREKRMYLVQAHEEEIKKQEQLNQMKMKFFTNISHELRTPLTLIVSPLETMIRECKEPDTLKRLKLMQRNSNHLLTLVNQILDFRKSEHTELQLQAAVGDIMTYIGEIGKDLTAMAEIKGINYTVTVEPQPLYMSFDSDKVAKIISNLVTNAIKFTPTGGDVSLTASSSGDMLTICVSDTGIGISDHDKEHIFERFYQAQSTEPISMAGAGIGLNMVAEYAKAHNGSVRVEDNPKGRGVRFIVELPVPFDIDEEPEQEPMPAATALEPAAAPAVARTRPVALIVDDNPDIIELLSDTLAADYDVVAAANGREALGKIKGTRPDIILTDVMMPEMDGIEFCRRVKSNPSTADIPVIMLTAKHDISARLEGLTIGAEDYLTKPFNNQEMLLRMRKFISLTREGAKRQVLDPKPADIAITSLDEKLVERAVKYVEDNMDRSDLSVEELSAHLGMSRVHLYKKLSQITGKTPIEFIRILRLKRAAQMLRESQMNISEIAFATGFGSPKYFSKYFKDEYGMLPSAYQSAYGI